MQVMQPIFIVTRSSMSKRYSEVWLSLLIHFFQHLFLLSFLCDLFFCFCFISILSRLCLLWPISHLSQHLAPIFSREISCHLLNTSIHVYTNFFFEIMCFRNVCLGNNHPLINVWLNTCDKASYFNFFNLNFNYSVKWLLANN